MKSHKPRSANCKKTSSYKVSRKASDAWADGDGSLVADDLMLREDAPGTPEANAHPFDLEERTAVFGERVVRFVKRIPKGPDNNRLIDQLVGAGTSVGANYCEASEAMSAKDFRHSISRCIKEAKETRLFLRLVAASEPTLVEDARTLYRETCELIRIFGSMYRKRNPPA